MEQSQEHAPTRSHQDELEIAWAAGLFEGEGFTTRRPVGKRVYLEVGIEIRDLDILTRFVDILRKNGITPMQRRYKRRQSCSVVDGQLAICPPSSLSSLPPAR